jgi:Domain of unknown function (DUF5667)
MISLAARRRQALEFARAVEAETPEVTSELVDPLQVVTLLRDVPPEEPDPTFVSRLRDKLLSAAAARAEKLESADEGPDDDLAWRRARSPRHQRLLAIAASTLVIVGAGTATAAASRQALPGDLLYPVKRSMETVQLQLARGNYGKGVELLEDASTRLDEIAGLTTEHPNPDAEQVDQLDQTFSDFSSESTEGGQRLLAAYAMDDEANAIGRIRVFTTEAAVQLTELASAMPPDMGPSFTKAAATVGTLDALAVRICPTCGGPLPLVTVPGELPASQVLPAYTFLAQIPHADLSELSSAGAGGSQAVTLPGGPTAGANPGVSTTSSATTTAGATPTTSGGEPTPTTATTAPSTSGPTSGESSPSANLGTSTASEVLPPVTTTLPVELPTITIPVLSPAGGPT